MAEEEQGIDLDALWTVGLDKIEKLIPDEPDDEDHFATEFELQGPAANGTVTVIVFNPVDEADIIHTARAGVQDALKRWLKVLEMQNGTGPVEPAQS